MRRKRRTAEQIIRKLCDAEVELAMGQTAGELVGKVGLPPLLDPDALLLEGG